MHDSGRMAGNNSPDMNLERDVLRFG
jgi:hypothetical protein